jgi:hypothetical protein
MSWIDDSTRGRLTAVPGGSHMFIHVIDEMSIEHGVFHQNPYKSTVAETN